MTASIQLNQSDTQIKYKINAFNLKNRVFRQTTGLNNFFIFKQKFQPSILNIIREIYVSPKPFLTKRQANGHYE